MRARWPALVVLLALAAAVAGGGCEQIVQWMPPDNGDAGDGGDDGGQDAGQDAGMDGGDDGGANLGDGGTGAWLFSFGPDSQFLRAPADGGATYPNPLVLRILRGGESGPVQVDISSADASVAWVPGGTVTVPSGQVTVPVLLNSTATGTTILTARFDGGQAQAMVRVLPTIVLSEIAAKTDGNDNDEFVELYNPTPLDFSLNGYELQYHSTNMLAQYLSIVTLGSPKHIAPFSFFLVGINGYTRSSNEDAHSTWITGALSATAGTVRLGAPGIGLNLSEPLAIDTVGWGSGAQGPEGSPVDTTLLVNWGSIERKAKASSTSSTMSGGVDDTGGNAYDTGDNSRDFVIHTALSGISAQDPQTSLAAPEFPDGG